jgi:hypothetical protein
MDERALDNKTPKTIVYKDFGKYNAIEGQDFIAIKVH